MATRVVALPRNRTAVREAQRQARGHSRAVGFLLVPVGLLLVLGLGAILSASSVVGLRETGDGLYYFKRQIAWLGAGVFGLVAAAMTPLRWWRKMAFPLFVATVGMLVAVLFFGVRSNGAQRWLEIGPITLQPSEIAKLTTILFLATIVSRREDSMYRVRDFFWPVAGSVGIVAFLVIMQPDLGTTLLVAAGSFAVLVASTAPFLYVAVQRWWRQLCLHTDGPGSPPFWISSPIRSDPPIKPCRAWSPLAPADSGVSGLEPVERAGLSFPTPTLISCFRFSVRRPDWQDHLPWSSCSRFSRSPARPLRCAPPTVSDACLRSESLHGSQPRRSSTSVE